jgi:hypothetical protein
MASTPEGRVKSAVKAELIRRGIWFYMPVQNGMGQVGIPDFVCCWNGRFLGVETKAPGKLKHTTPNQDRVLAEIRDHAGHALVVDDVEQLRTYLDGALWRT